MPDLTNGVLTDISSFVAAAAALGTAAYGLVDASKAFGGGASRVGFKSVRNAVDRLLGRAGGPGMYGTADVLATLQANWVNGVAKADQKAAAKSLVRLALTPANAPGLAWAVGVDATELAAIAGKIQTGATLTQQELGVLGRFDVIVSAILDEAYERGDQQYRNWAKLWAAVVAIMLAAIGGGLIYCNGSTPHSVADYFRSPELLLAILIGAISTPLAPIAKDLSTAFTAAVSAVGTWKR
jgi:hypothetical protein